MKKNNNLLLFGAAGVCFLIFGVLAIIYLSDSIFSSNNKKITIPSESNGTGFSEDTDPAKIQEVNQSSDVMSLLNKTPFDGKNFSFFYNYDGNFFTLYLNPSNPSAGNVEFDAFLKANGIKSRFWIYDLRIVSAKPTPEP